MESKLTKSWAGSFNLNKNDFTSKKAVLTGKVGPKPPSVQDAKGFSSLQIATITETIGQATIHDWLTKVTLRSSE